MKTHLTKFKFFHSVNLFGGRSGGVIYCMMAL